MTSRPGNAPVGESALPRSRRAWDLRVALVNNMPDAALATERQSAGLIAASSGEWRAHVDLYTLSGAPCSAETRLAMAPRCGDLNDLIAKPPDVLIVAGAEPRAADLADEPYWLELTRLIDWARSSAVTAALYLRLAEHAAVQFAAGVRRHRLPTKLCGACAAHVVQKHELTEGLAAPLSRHSRCNDIDERELIDNGYIILTRSSRAGVEAFAKESATLEAFWQGHPECEADTVACELPRDIQRYTGGATHTPPPLPKHYLTPEADARLEIHIAEVTRGAASTVESFTLATLGPRAASWAKGLRALMGAFLAVAFRRSRFCDAAETAETLFVGI